MAILQKSHVYLSMIMQGCGGPVAYPKMHRAEGRVDSMDNLKVPVYLTVFLYCGGRLVNKGEHANTTQRAGGHSNPKQQRRQ